MVRNHDRILKEIEQLDLDTRIKRYSDIIRELHPGHNDARRISMLLLLDLVDKVVNPKPAAKKPVPKTETK